MIDCKFRISYKIDKASGCYDFNETKANFQHSHPLDYKGLSKRKKMESLEYMAQSELQSKSRLKDITQKTQAFIQGQANDHLIELQKQQTAYLVKKTKEKIWGLPQKDAENLNKLMEQIKNQFPDGLIKMQVDELGQLRNFIFSSSNMKNQYLKFKDIILMDSTYRTNKYKLPLYVIAGVNENSKTFVIGFGFVRSEEAKDVSWILNELFTFFGDSPTLICTDSCPTMSKVIKEILPNTTHLICAWHVSQNIKKHLSGLRKIIFHLFN